MFQLVPAANRCLGLKLRGRRVPRGWRASPRGSPGKQHRAQESAFSHSAVSLLCHPCRGATWNVTREPSHLFQIPDNRGGRGGGRERHRAGQVAGVRAWHLDHGLNSSEASQGEKGGANDALSLTAPCGSLFALPALRLPCDLVTEQLLPAQLPGGQRWTCYQRCWLRAGLHRRGRRASEGLPSSYGDDRERPSSARGQQAPGGSQRGHQDLSASPGRRIRGPRLGTRRP